jgi:uncharacterized membrane protein (UPF0127 family)
MNFSILRNLAKSLAHPRPKPTIAIRFGKKKITAELAKGTFQKALGLMMRKGLEENRGMLFDFHDETSPSMWMFGMRFPIDMIWLDGGFRIVHMERDCNPLNIWKIYSPKEKARYVLETKAGFCESNGLKEGQYAHFC